MKFNYNPSNYKLPAMPKLQPVNSNPQPASVKNSYAQNILDMLGRNIKAPTGYFQNNDLQTQLFPTQELGNQFVQQNLLPEFMQDTFNPFIRNMGNQMAGSNMSLLGNNQRNIQQNTGQLTRSFQNQANDVLAKFDADAFRRIQDNIKNNQIKL